jgi:starvation-inducible DNA-binding protein
MPRMIGVPMEQLVRATAVGHLQTTLVDLVALGLNGKQLHWIVTGPVFKPVHELLDEIVDSTREYADRIAERIVTLGMPADARPATIAQPSVMPEPAADFIDGLFAVDYFAEQLHGVVQRARIAVDQVVEEQVTQDLIITILHGLEKHLWMLQAHVAGQ